jgi:hypothetical protein
MAQRLNPQTHSRVIRVNTAYFLVWKTSYASEYKNLAQQLIINKTDAELLVKCDRNFTKQSHGFIRLDVRGNSTQDLPLAVRDSSWLCLVSELLNIIHMYHTYKTWHTKCVPWQLIMFVKDNFDDVSGTAPQLRMKQLGAMPVEISNRKMHLPAMACPHPDESQKRPRSAGLTTTSPWPIQTAVRCFSRRKRR